MLGSLLYTHNLFLSIPSPFPHSPFASLQHTKLKDIHKNLHITGVYLIACSAHTYYIQQAHTLSSSLTHFPHFLNNFGNKIILNFRRKRHFFHLSGAATSKYYYHPESRQTAVTLIATPTEYLSAGSMAAAKKRKISLFVFVCAREREKKRKWERQQQ